MTGYRLGVDIGGTFTDIVLLGADGSLYSKKVLSTPDDYSRAIEEGVAELLAGTGIAASAVAEFAHGTTIATNTIIERQGVPVALITTKGFRDALELGRFRMPRLYDLRFQKPDPLVPRDLRFEVPERMTAQGEIQTPVDLAALDAVADRVKAAGIRAIAVCFLNSYVNPANEAVAYRHLRERLPEVSISTSTQLLPQIQEYERTSTTVVNAYLRPVVEAYVAKLSERMRRLGITVPLMIMQSSGGVLPGPLVGANPVYIIESGPAAGVVGAHRMSAQLDLGDLMVLDMGGTTAKASIVKDGTITIVPESEVGGDALLGHRLIQGSGFAVQVPTIDIAEVGAGGGSIAYVDTGGSLRVGPRSAGAVPGPVCYDRGGTDATVTDANLVLGYLNPEALVGGELKVHFGKAEAALSALAGKLKLSPTDTAYGIHLIANANMMRALSGVSSERGQDPARFTLLAMGGNGAVHGGGLAETLGIGRIIVPPVAGLFSALGLLSADVEHQIIRAYYRRLEAIKAEELNAFLKPLVAEAEALLEAEGFTQPRHRRVEVMMEMKYVGQASSLSVPLGGYPPTLAEIAALARAYNDLHQQNYGYHTTDERYQIIAVKVLGRGLSETPRLPARVSRARERISAEGERRAYFGPGHGWLTTPVRPRIALGAKPVAGPLIVEEYDTTSVVRPGWSARLDSWNNIVLERA